MAKNDNCKWVCFAELLTEPVHSPQSSVYRCPKDSVVVGHPLKPEITSVNSSSYDITVAWKQSSHSFI